MEIKIFISVMKASIAQSVVRSAVKPEEINSLSPKGRWFDPNWERSHFLHFFLNSIGRAQLLEWNKRLFTYHRKD
jgi:hypothetical protein